MKLIPASLTGRVLLGLVLGLAAGLALSAAGGSVLTRAAAVVEPVGTLWVNAIRMTVIPLVVSSLIAGVASTRDARVLGRVGGGALALFLLLLFSATALALLIGAPLLARLPIDAGAAAGLRAMAGSAGDVAARGAALPGLRGWLIGLIPPNPVKAAADGALLPLILFSLAFGLALARVRPDARGVVVRGIEGVAAAMLTLVKWVLDLAPIGVFALALPVAARLGLAAAGAIAYYVLVVVAVCIVCIAGLYPFAAGFGRIRLREFARAIAPAQAVAFSSRSSLASLPVMIELADERLKLPPEIGAFYLPLAASTFRIAGALGQMIGVLFIARLYGAHLGAAQIATISVTSVIATFGIPGIPGGSILILVPILVAAGVPAAGIGLLLGVDTIPDMFRTVANVTADMAVAVVLARAVTRASRVPTGEAIPPLRVTSSAAAVSGASGGDLP